ncbi:MAG: dockerin type I repeat-containing protein, partial [Eubacteriales bacterium]|nr:dockerin type I repeat-containing protein [Eubacteriales bacterium]
PDSTLPGDANLDGEVTNADAVLIMRHSMGVVELTGHALLNADCSGDGIVNTGDALKALRMAVGIG